MAKLKDSSNIQYVLHDQANVVLMNPSPFAPGHFTSNCLAPIGNLSHSCFRLIFNAADLKATKLAVIVI